MSRSLAPVLALAALLPLTGCDALSSVLGVKKPTAFLNRVDLVKSPPLMDMVGYTCYEEFSASSCQWAGWNSKPSKANMEFSFDVVFDLFNANENIPIPLAELLLGFTVFGDQNLGAVCVSFCDPEAESCDSAGVNLAGACEIDKETTEVDEAGDLVPTVDDLMGLANDVASGSTENWEFRVIPSASVSECQEPTAVCTEEEQDGELMMCCDGECTPMAHEECVVQDNEAGKPCAHCDGHNEAHIRFDLNVDKMLNLGQRLLSDAVEDAISGRNIRLDIPYSADGTVFFEVPNLGDYALGFGPFEDEWRLTQ